MSEAEVISDLIELERLVDDEPDSERREALVRIHDNLAARSEGAKVADAAHVLSVSLATVRGWIDGGILDEVADKTPRRVTLDSLAAVKRALDEIRAHADDPLVLAHVSRILRDRTALEGSEEGFEDYRAGRVTRLTPDLLDEIDQARRLEAAAALASEAQTSGSTDPLAGTPPSPARPADGPPAGGPAS